MNSQLRRQQQQQPPPPSTTTTTSSKVRSLKWELDWRVLAAYCMSVAAPADDSRPEVSFVRSTERSALPRVMATISIAPHSCCCTLKTSVVLASLGSPTARQGLSWPVWLHQSLRGQRTVSLPLSATSNTDDVRRPTPHAALQR